MTRNLKVASNTAWLVACRAGANALNLLLFVAVSRAFGPAGVGAYSYAFAIAGFVFVASGLGIDEYGIREYARLPPAERPHLLARLLGTQCLMLGLAAIGVVLFLALTHASSETIAMVAALSLYQMACAVAGTLYVPALANQSMKGPALAELLCRGGAYVVAAAAILFGGWSLVPAVSTFALFGIAALGAGTWLARKHCGRVRIEFARREVRRTVGVLWSFAAGEIMVQAYSRAGLLILMLVLGEAAAGLYATGAKFIETVAIPFGFLGIAAYPRLSQLASLDADAFARLARRLARFWLITSAFTVWALYFVAPLVLVPLLGERFAAAAPVLRNMTFLALMQLLQVLLVRLMLSADLQVARLRIVTGAAIACVLLSLALVPRLGVDGAIIASSVTLVGLNVLYARQLQRRFPQLQIGRIGLVLLAVALPAAAAAWAFSRLGSSHYVVAIAALLVLLLACAPTALELLRRGLGSPARS